MAVVERLKSAGTKKSDRCREVAVSGASTVIRHVLWHIFFSVSSNTKLTWICDGDRHNLVSVQIRFNAHHRQVIQEQWFLERFGKSDKVRRLHLEPGELQRERFARGNRVCLLCSWDHDLGIFSSVVCEFDVKVVH